MAHWKSLNILTFSLQKRELSLKNSLKKINLLMSNNISTNELETIISKIELGIVIDELLCLIEIKLGSVINH
jgi:hypothetical protein